jgi:hypothetical protein
VYNTLEKKINAFKETDFLEDLGGDGKYHNGC